MNDREVKAMDTTLTLSAAARPSVSLEIDLRDLIIRVHALGGFGNPATVTVVTGCVAVASHAGETFDQDGIPEVYLPGEIVGRSEFRGSKNCYVAVLAQYPGTVMVDVAQRLAGLSQDATDLAVVRFLYLLRLEDPIKLLSREARWCDPGGPARPAWLFRPASPGRPSGAELLKEKVKKLIEMETESTVHDRVQLWSNPDIREVSGSLFSRLDGLLRAWGLRLDSVSANRRYPASLYKIVLQFKTAEKCLLDAEPMERHQILIERLGLREANLPGIIADIRNFSESGKRGGAGLFTVVKERRRLAAEQGRLSIEGLVEWLQDESLLEAAIFLEELYSDKYDTQERELTEQIVFSAFRYPMLGLGEWGDTEHSLADVSRYRRIEARWEAPAR
ncbi:MAG: hypothetical protein FJZ93_04795 [Chloroflexi bacterium]|nr:hypothetical protein [Chloroflexota bacterium]